MVSINGIHNRMIPVERPSRPVSGDTEAAMGKSAESVGHRAKAAAAESGDEAANAIGKAAAMIARLTVDQADPA